MLDVYILHLGQRSSQMIDASLVVAGCWLLKICIWIM